MATAEITNPLYNRSAHMFKNVEEGPRKLTDSEMHRIEQLKANIRVLEDRGTSLRKKVFDNFEVSVPFGVASGPAYGSKFLGLYTQLGYGFVTQKTVRDRKWEGNPVPNVIYLKGGTFEEGFTISAEPTMMMTNSFGMTSIDPEEWKADLAEFKVRNPGTPLVLSGVGTKATTSKENVDQHVKLGQIAEKIGASAYEVNVSCPNEMEGHSGELQDDLDFMKDVLEQLTATLKIPVLVKIGYRESLPKFVLATGKILDGKGGLVAINTKPAVVRKADGSYAYGESRQRAGINMAPLVPFAKDALKQLVKSKERIRL